MRIGAQLFFLALWGVLFMQTRVQGEGRSIWPDFFLVTDPLVAMLTIGSSRVLVPVLLISGGFIVFTLVFGRAFCSWICPLGTLIDGSKHVFRPRDDRFSQATHESMQRWKYYMLVFMAFGALMGAQWVFLFDPLVLMFRGATSIYPVAAAALPAGWVSGEYAVQASEVPLLPIFLFLGSIGLTALTPRFWCRYLCPLGAFYGLLSKQPLLRRRVKGCDVCHGREVEKECVSGCRMGAVPVKPGRTQNHECIRCFSGAHDCHKDAIQFGFMKPVLEKSDAGLDLDRRAFLTGGVTALGTAPLVALGGYHRGGKNNRCRDMQIASHIGIEFLPFGVSHAHREDIRQRSLMIQAGSKTVVTPQHQQTFPFVNRFRQGVQRFRIRAHAMQRTGIQIDKNVHIVTWVGEQFLILGQRPVSH
jgi:polyferredoxin